MAYFLLLVVFVTFLLMAWAKYQRGDATQKAAVIRSLVKYGFWAILALLVFRGRIFWLYGAVLAVIPLIPGLYINFLQKWRNRNTVDENEQHPVLTDEAEAMEILGLSGDLDRGEITADMITDAHKRLIQKLHPDRGGNDYLAAKINQARDLLLKRINR